MTASSNAASANRSDVIFVLCSNGMCIRLQLELSETALADHAFPRSAMRLTTNRHDGEREGWTPGPAIDYHRRQRKNTFGEELMKHWLAGLLLLIGPPAFAQQVPPIAFDSVPNPLHLPTNLYFGEVSGVSVNSKCPVFVLSRGNTSGPAYAAAATQLLEFDSKGGFVREIGKNLYAWSFGHTVKVDPADNIWVTDKGSDMVIKFDPEGRVVMVFGRKQEASDEDTGPLKHPKPPLPAEDGRFRPVTDVAWRNRPSSAGSGGFGCFKGAVSSSEASCLRPNTMTTRPSGSNLITMSEPLSVTQMLSAGSTLTVCPNDQA